MTLDYEVLKSVQKLHTEFGDWLMTNLTALGDRGVVWIVLTVILLLIPRTRKWGVAVAAALILASVLGNQVIKPLVGRLRPFQTYTEFLPLLIAAPGGFSFPSGHTGASFAAATAIFAFHRRWGWLAFLLAAGIAFSRMYLAVHYPTDILGGIFLGAVCGCFSAWAVKRLWPEKR